MERLGGPDARGAWEGSRPEGRPIPVDAPILARERPPCIGVSADPEKPSAPDGIAYPTSYVADPTGRPPAATFRIVLRKVELPGRFVCMARRFVPVDDWLRSSPSILIKVISGGQTGADMGGLIAARDAGIPTGGSIPRGFPTEAGPRPDLGLDFGLVEVEGGYPERTRRNVADADGTLIYARRRDLEGGTALTLAEARRLGKPHYLALAEEPEGLEPEAVASWIRAEGVRVLNVAGPRASKAPRVEAFVRGHLDCVIRNLRELR